MKSFQEFLAEALSKPAEDKEEPCKEELAEKKCECEQCKERCEEELEEEEQECEE